MSDPNEPARDEVIEVPAEAPPPEPTALDISTWPATTLPVLAPRTSQPSRLPLAAWLVALLVPYAIGATFGIVYLLQQQERNKTAHILESIPDQGLYEDFYDGRRRDVQQPISKASEQPGVSKIIPPTEPVLPELIPLLLGEARRVGMLTVKPMSISKRQLHFVYRAGQSNVKDEETLVLVLQVKNEGPLIFRPDDETFNRVFLHEGRTPVYTFLELGSERFYGAVSDPSQERLDVPVVPSLLPGESAEVTVVAYRSSDGKRFAANELKAGMEGIWRVQLRKGKEEITMQSGKKRSVWVTTVVPIAVRASDLH